MQASWGQNFQLLSNGGFSMNLLNNIRNMNKKAQKISVKIVTLIHGGIYGDNIYQNGVK